MEILKEIYIQAKADLESEEAKNQQDLTLSPRSVSFKQRFDFEEDEFLVSKYSCAYKNKILLRGSLYFTNQRVLFWSPFNNSNLIFGKATKVSFKISKITNLTKVKTALVIDNSLMIETNEPNKYKFVHFMHRNEVYDILTSLIDQVKHNENRVLEECMKLIKANNKDHYGKKEPVEEVKQVEEGPSEIPDEYEEPEEEQKEPEKLPEDLSIPYQEMLDHVRSISETNMEKLPSMHEYFTPKFQDKFKPVTTEVFEGFNLKTVYRKIYSDFKLDGEQSFKRLFTEKNENYDIVEEPFTLEIPEYFSTEWEKGLQEYEIGELEDKFQTDQVPNSTYKISYTHPINRPLLPPSCQVSETHLHYYVSPSKIVTLTQLDNSGFQYCDAFKPLIMSTLEESMQGGLVSTKLEVKAYIYFVKKVLFFQGKIEKGGYDEIQNSVKEVFLPLARACLDS